MTANLTLILILTIALTLTLTLSQAERLLRSCARVGVCCKATLLPPDAFGPDAPEGSESFRFQMIASKPSFMLSELKSTGLPVVFLDTDLEFHSFPHLFVSGRSYSPIPYPHPYPHSCPSS